MRLALNCTQSYTANDELGEAEVNDHYGQNGYCDNHVDMSHGDGREVLTTPHVNHDRQSLHVGLGDQQVRCEVVVPGGYECEDSLNSHSGLQDRQDDGVECSELIRTIDTSRFNDIQRERAVHVLLHEEEYGGSSNCRNDQRKQIICQLPASHHIYETESGYLCRNCHDEQDEVERELSSLEVVNVAAISCHSGEVNRAEYATDGNDKAVDKTSPHRNVRIVQDRCKVCYKLITGQNSEAALLDLKVRTCTVDKHDIEEEQTEYAHQSEHNVSNSSSEVEPELTLVMYNIIFICHCLHPLLLCLLAGKGFCTAKSSISKEVVNYQAEQSTNNEQYYRDSTCCTVVLGVQVIIQVHDKCLCCVVGAADASGDDLRNIEHLQTADQRCDENIDHDGSDKGHCDLPEDLVGSTTIDISSLDQGFINTHHSCHQQDGGVTEPHQEVHECYNTSC